MSRMAGERRGFQEYLDDYDRTKRGSGSDKEPPVDKMSRKDLAHVFKKGIKRGLSRYESATDVLDYFDDIKDDTKYGDKAKKYIKKLRGIVRDGEEPRAVQEEEDPRFPNEPIAGGDTGVNLFGDPDRQDEVVATNYTEPFGPANVFASSYFDYLGGGLDDTSDPRNFYLQGLEGPVGLARSVIPARTERPVPAGMDSFLYPLVRDDDGDLIDIEDQPGFEQDFIANEATKALQQLIGGFYSA